MRPDMLYKKIFQASLKLYRIWVGDFFEADEVGEGFGGVLAAHVGFGAQAAAHSWSVRVAEQLAAVVVG